MDAELVWDLSPDLANPHAFVSFNSVDSEKCNGQRSVEIKRAAKTPRTKSGVITMNGKTMASENVIMSQKHSVGFVDLLFWFWSNKTEF